MPQIVSVSTVKHELPQSDGVQGPFVGFVFHYEDGVDYEVGPVLSEDEFKAVLSAHAPQAGFAPSAD